MRKLLAFVDDERGATAIEYGLIAALIAVGCIAAFTILGGGLQALFGTSETGVGGKLDDATGQALAQLFFPSTFVKLTSALPGFSGCCWLSCGAQPLSQRISSVARTRPSASPAIRS